MCYQRQNTKSLRRTSFFERITLVQKIFRLAGLDPSFNVFVENWIPAFAEMTFFIRVGIEEAYYNYL